MVGVVHCKIETVTRKHFLVFNLAKRPTNDDDICLVVSVFRVVPVEALLVELDNNLRNLRVSFLGWNQICFVRTLPFDQEEQLSGIVGRSDDSFRRQTSSKSSWLVLVLFFLLLFFRPH